mmetsp:Transcript_838/g.2020  ORF Transcript_838/g.2020 Transcript_838/m.2020 type:complete len:158 (-) Transcript_838:655-1128(-)
MVCLDCTTAPALQWTDYRQGMPTPMSLTPHFIWLSGVLTTQPTPFPTAQNQHITSTYDRIPTLTQAKTQRPPLCGLPSKTISHPAHLVGRSRTTENTCCLMDCSQRFWDWIHQDSPFSKGPIDEPSAAECLGSHFHPGCAAPTPQRAVSVLLKRRGR